MSNFLKTKNIQIVGEDGKPVCLRGINLGGWLMMEAYIMHAPNFPEHKFKDTFKKHLGPEALDDLNQAFRDNFITEEDIERIASLGLNCLRVPFNYRLVESKSYGFKEEGILYLDRVINWAKKHGIYIILDLHAAPGCQNHDWHSDSSGKAELFSDKGCQQRTFAIWKHLADRYKDEGTVAGYDLLNETVLSDSDKLNVFYKQLIGHIRSVDKNHILFIEGNTWATDINCLDRFDDDNYVLSIHNYIPLDFVFNFVQHLSYPLKSWGRENTREHLARYKKVAEKYAVPLYLGEFGVNARKGLFNEDKWLEDVLSACNDLGIHWTYWTYKAVKNTMFPDGVFSYYDNPKWVNRMGPLSGWDTYHFHWEENSHKMIDSWRTYNFTENKEISDLLRKYAKG